jgi:cysteine-rich repeat protein
MLFHHASNDQEQARYFVVLVLSSALSMLLIAFGFYAAPQAEAVDLPTTLTISVCGDAIATSGEACDDGAAANTGDYGSSTAERKCLSDCTGFGPYCGDGILQVRFTEECDDGENDDGDLCSAQCISEAPAPPSGGGTPVNGSPTLGGVPSSGGTQGSISSIPETRVVLRGRAYPNSTVSILLDGNVIGTTNADNSANFVYSTSDVTAGTATFGFRAADPVGTESILTSAVFEVLQSAVTTVANIFIPPTIRLSENQIPPGEPLTISGSSVPAASVLTEINAESGGSADTLTSTVETDGAWALQVDTASLQAGFHTAKAFFRLSDAEESGFGKAVSFYIGDGPPPEGEVSPDVNGDGKVNLVDFSIFLTVWGTDDIRNDFNRDGTVNLADFSIMLFNWTG